MKNIKKLKITLSLAILLGITINFSITNAEAQDSEISDVNSCFTRIVNRPNQQSLVCNGGSSVLCSWVDGKGKDKASCN